MKTRRMKGRGRDEDIARLTAEAKALSAQMDIHKTSTPETAALVAKIHAIHEQLEKLKKQGGRRRRSTRRR